MEASMEDKQQIISWFAELLFKLKLMEAQVSVMEVMDMTDFGIAELKSIANNFIITGQSIEQEINEKMMEAL